MLASGMRYNDSMQPRKAHSKDDIVRYAEYHMETHGATCSLNHIDVSEVTDMASLFSARQKMRAFNGDISQWKPEKVTNMRRMFGNSAFNGDLSQWKTPRCHTLSNMFDSSVFDGDLSAWDVSGVQRMDNMFKNSVFNGDISKWDVSRSQFAAGMFMQSLFNQDIGVWNTTRFLDASEMFKDSQFVQDVSMWDLARAKKGTTGMFLNNIKGLQAQGMSAWVLDMLIEEKLPFHDQKWRLAAKRYDALSQSMGLDPADRHAHISAIHSTLVNPIEPVSIAHLDLG